MKGIELRGAGITEADRQALQQAVQDSGGNRYRIFYLYYLEGYRIGEAVARTSLPTKETE